MTGRHLSAVWALGVLYACAIPRAVVIDETARPRNGEVTCVEADKLTYDERLLLEQVTHYVASQLSSTISELQVRVVCDRTASEFASVSGHTVYLSANAMRWVLNASNSKLWRERTLEFLVGHEVGHLVSAVCHDPCARAFACEQRADEFASNIAGRASGLLLLEAADRSWTDLDRILGRGQSCRDNDCLSLVVGDAVAMCLAETETMIRYTAALEHESQQGASTWEARKETQETIKFVGQRRKHLGKHADVCSRLVDMLPASESRVCQQHRVDEVREALRHAPEVPELTSPRLRSPQSRWRDDAAVVTSIDTAAGRRWVTSGGDAGQASTGWTSRIFVGYEGGRAESYGLRLGYGRWHLGPDSASAGPPTTDYTAEFAAQEPFRLFGNTIALLSSGGLGLLYRQSSSRAGTKLFVEIGPQIAFRVLPRIHVSAGFNVYFDSARMLTVSIPLTVDIHLGRY